jgi:uncharacterized membrane protein (UPF0127 family)
VTRRRALSSLLEIALVLPACGVFLAACKSQPQPAAREAPLPAAPSGPVVVIDTGERRLTFHVEVARTPQQRELGLMFREKLAPDAGMLFVFDSQGPLTFWMKNTRIPLDMIFIDEQRRIVGIVANAEPETLTPRRVDAPSRYVLEIGGGIAAQLGIHAGLGVELRVPELR